MESQVYSEEMMKRASNGLPCAVGWRGRSSRSEFGKRSRLPSPSLWAAMCYLALCLCVQGVTSQRQLIDVNDIITAEDIAGECANGCVRYLTRAVAGVTGETECDLRVQNLLDHTKNDVDGGTLNVVHACSDADGNLVYQVGCSATGRGDVGGGCDAKIQAYTCGRAEESEGA